MVIKSLRDCDNNLLPARKIFLAGNEQKDLTLDWIRFVIKTRGAVIYKTQNTVLKDTLTAQQPRKPQKTQEET